MATIVVIEQQQLFLSHALPGGLGWIDGLFLVV